MTDTTIDRWNSWNSTGGPKYPHEKVIQFFFRNHNTIDARRAVYALDLGCGSGVHSVFLASEGARVLAADIAPVGVEHTRQRLAQANLEATVVCAGIDEVPLPAGELNLVVCVGVLDCAGPESTARALPRLAKALAPGAKAIFVFASDRDFRVRGPNPFKLHGYSRAEVEALFRPHFPNAAIDNYITTFDSGTSEQNDWLVTVR